MDGRDRPQLGRRGLTRRDLLWLGAAATAAALVPTAAAAAPPGGKPGAGLADPRTHPYTGGIPLVFPLVDGTYRKPLQDNWHDDREGPGYPWSHQNGLAADGTIQRAHDGVDIFPRFATSLPTVYAPFSAQVAEVYIAGTGQDGDYYQRHPTIAPPWAYPRVPAPGANIYGSYIWLYSIAADKSAGYFAFYCHLRSDTTPGSPLRTMADYAASNTPIDVRTPVGTMGDSGNAGGQPQLHMELHYPQNATSPDVKEGFLCAHCDPDKGPLTAFNPFPSLSNARAL